MKKKRFNRTDWLIFGLEQLAEKGPDALKLVTLCQSAGRTTGSFYHHFEDQNAFTDAMLNHWQKANTDDVIEAVEGVLDSGKRSERLNTIAMTMNQSIEVGVRVFAQQNASAAQLVSEVDQIRIDYLTSIYSDRLGLEKEMSKNLAELEYAAFVGTQIIWKGGSLEHGMKLSSLFDNLVAKYFQQPE